MLSRFGAMRKALPPPNPISRPFRGEMGKTYRSINPRMALPEHAGPSVYNTNIGAVLEPGYSTTMGGGVLGRMHNLFGEQYAGMGGAFFAGVKTGLFSMFRSDPYGSLMSGVTKAGLKAQNVKGAKLNMAMKQFRQGMYDIRSGGAGMLPDVKNRGMLEIAGTVGLGIGELGQYAGLRAMTGMNLFHFAGMKAGHFAGTKGYSPVEPRGGGIRGAMSYGSRSSIQGMKGFGAGTVGGLGVAGLGAMLF